MTRKEAAKLLIQSRVTEQYEDLCYYIEGYNEANSMAIAALREQEERSKAVTNADRIRAMSDEELLKVFNVAMNACPPDTEEDRWCDADDDCERCWLEWLKQPVKEDA